MANEVCSQTFSITAALFIWVFTVENELACSDLTTRLENTLAVLWWTAVGNQMIPC